MRVRGAVAAFLLVLTGFHADRALAKAPPPVEAYAGPAMAASLQLSPDGTHVAFLAPVEGRHALVIRKLTPGPNDRPTVFPAGDLNIRWFEWVNEERLLLGVGRAEEVQTAAGKVPLRFSRLVSLNRDGSDAKVLLRPPRGLAIPVVAGDSVIQFIDREHVLVAYPSNDDVWPDVVRLNVYTGRTERVARGTTSIQGYLPDPSGQARIAQRYSDRDQTQTWVVRDGIGSSFRTLREVRIGQDPDFSVLGFGSDPKTLYVASGHEGDKTAVYEFDLAANAFGRKVVSDPDFDVGAPVFRRGEVVGISYARDLPRRVWFDPATQALQDQLDAALPDSAEIIVDSTRDGRFTLVASYHPAEPVTFRMFDREARELVFFADTFPAIPQEALARQEAVSYAARDGLRIPAYLTLPPAKLYGQTRNLPAVVLPHGGPIARDYQQFDQLAQFLASRGYAVLQPQFRGSSGFGRAFLEAGFREWGGKMQTDVIDGVQWMIQQGIADPSRICIVGWSYGGYSALMGAIQNPEMFRCAIATAPVADIPRLYREMRYMAARELNRGIFFGDDPGDLRPISPVHNADRIGVPVLLIHGDMDAQALVIHSREMNRALQRAGKPVEYIEIPGMDHSPSTTQDMVTVLSAWERFLAQHLGNGRTPGG